MNFVTEKFIYSFALNSKIISIGRDSDNDITLGAFGISKKHAKINLIPRKPKIIDCESSFGVRIDHKPVKEGELINGCILGIGIIEFDVKIKKNILYLERKFDQLEVKDLPEIDTSKSIEIGRDSSNIVQLIHPLISRFHCSISKIEDKKYTIIDHGSTNGTFLNGRRVNRAILKDSDIIQIGPFRYIFNEGKIVKADDAGRIKVEAVNISVKKRRKTLLDNVSITIQPGEFVVILGPSGAGKTTFARALSCHLHVNSGTVYYNGFPMNKFGAAFSSIIGYVSQKNLLRPELTVWETLWEQVVFRLPKDSLAQERISRINEVMDVLNISHLQKSRISNLSGGEAKRVHLGIELLSSPTIIFLDEPLAGLDPGLTYKFMELFKKLCEKGHTLLLTTHTLEQIELCNRLIFINSGKIVFSGTPEQVTNLMNITSVAEVYEKIRLDDLNLNENVTEAKIHEVKPKFEDLPESKLSSIRPKSAGFFRQFIMLITRYRKIISRDLINVSLLFFQAPLIAFLLRFVFSGDSQFLPLPFYFCISVSAIWIGGINSIREIASEWEFFNREYKAGLSLFAYVAAKCFVSSILALLQALLFVGTLNFLFEAFDFNFEMMVLCSATTISGAILGLCISALSNNITRAVSLLPIIFIPQIFFSGILTSFDQMPYYGRVISNLTISRPSFSMFKKVCLLNHNIFELIEWKTLVLLNFSLIIFIIIWILVSQSFSQSRQ